MSSPTITLNDQNKSGTRFGTKSHNMFFSRNVAHPRHLRFITGVGGVQICSIKENNYTYVPPPNPTNPTVAQSLLTDPKFTVTFPPNSYNEALLQTYSNKLALKKKKERILPPLRFWTSSGQIVEDTQRWRTELENLASSVGLMTSNELKNATQRLNTNKSNFPSSPNKTARKTARSADQLNKPSLYSETTGRLNETPKSSSGRSPSKSKSGSAYNKLLPNYVFCVENTEREMWMIQVLSQILQTDSMQEIQSWLVSAGQKEKDVAREIIQKALQGLQESGRIELEDVQGKKSVEIQVDFDQIKDTIKKINDTQQENHVLFARPNIALTHEEKELEKKKDNANTDEPNAQNKEQSQSPVKISDSINNAVTNSLVNFKPSGLYSDLKQDNLLNRPFTADVFKGKCDSRLDRKLSTKIIEELMHFVDIERKSSPTKATYIDSLSSRYKPLGSIVESKTDGNVKFKLEKSVDNDKQVLTIED